ncbi:hypothetical protein OG777_19555 [Micromonospora peucetia]|uniref:Cytochrome oxidase Cu insertion factor, SCO1/SenC/PrrC family n=1 Tax=Micromonospora peucetia TaxID=47871 RepID=A0A1C6V3Z8_9ACTN|nr:hypothetical protein [Micromonospora peucetia]MCX4389109.1 hypothetical protein [Micromonospora peucetia]WSA35311.1 hypothetical protein OIE14_15340 [Micromonospora peucetia]SCL60844.1 hypothetical protein GA0070608_2374 [Micromonospora peucetia]
MGKPDADGPGLPDLPPEWGRVVVPDDASALAADAEQIRRELRGTPRRATPSPPARPSLALPLLVLLVAVLTTLAGLAAVTWPRSTPAPATSPYAPPAGPTGRPLPALDLVDAGQSPVPLRGLVPMMIILVDGCSCPDDVATATALVPAGVTLVTVAGDRPLRFTPPPGASVRALADPAGGLRAFLHLPATPGVATALLVDRAGVLVKVVPEVRSAEDYRAELAHLAR